MGGLFLLILHTCLSEKNQMFNSDSEFEPQRELEFVFLFRKIVHLGNFKEVYTMKCHMWSRVACMYGCLKCTHRNVQY